MINLNQDAHVHTNFSPDADPNATFNAYILKAKQCGIKQLIFTDHLDLDPAHPLFKTPIDYDVYFQKYKERNILKDVDTKIGVEIGYQPHTIDQTMKLIDQYPFEYVILSVHYIDKQDFYTKEYFAGRSKKEAYDQYFEMCLEAIKKTPRFDAFGHLDYIPRYSELGDYCYEEYKDIIDDILKELIRKEKYLEINTSGFLTEKRAYPRPKVISRYQQLGGTKLIVGSDAHHVEELGRYYSVLPNYL